MKHHKNPFGITHLPLPFHSPPMQSTRLWLISEYNFYIIPYLFVANLLVEVAEAKEFEQEKSIRCLSRLNFFFFLLNYMLLTYDYLRIALNGLLFGDFYSIYSYYTLFLFEGRL